MYRITFLNGPAEGRRLTVRSGSVRVGRGADCAIRVSDPAMADRHAEVTEREGGIFVRNLDPLHGIEVDGRRSESVEIRIEGRERIKIGSTIFRVEPLSEPARTKPRRVTGLQVWAILAIALFMVGQAAMMWIFSKVQPGTETDAATSPATNIQAEKPATPTPEAPAIKTTVASPPAEPTPPPTSEPQPVKPDAPVAQEKPEPPAPVPTPAPAVEAPAPMPEPPALPPKEKPAAPPTEPETGSSPSPATRPETMTPETPAPRPEPPKSAPQPPPPEPEKPVTATPEEKPAAVAPSEAPNTPQREEAAIPTKAEEIKPAEMPPEPAQPEAPTDSAN